MTKKEMKERCQALLKQPVGTIFSGADHAFLVQLFSVHPKFKARTKGQDFKFEVRLNVSKKNNYTTKGFWIVRADDIASDISYIKALRPENKARDDREDVLKALRTAIAPDVAAFRKTVRFGIDTCPFTGEVLTIRNCHIDHYDKPFIELAEAFIRIIGLDYLVKKINPSDDGEIETYFTDQYIIKTFREYHNANTHLRAVSAIANTKIIPNEYRKK